jgi:hypothetical protein
MSTLRATLARFSLPLIGVYLVLVGFGLLTSVAISPLLVGVVALAAGICALCAS